MNRKVPEVIENYISEVIATLIRDWVAEGVNLDKFDIFIELYETPNSRTTTAFLDYNYDDILEIKWEGFNLG